MNILEELEQEYRKGKPWVYRFSNMFRFLDFCKAEQLTPERSRTAYDAENDCMYIEDLVKKELYRKNGWT